MQKLDKIVKRITDKMEALPKNYAQMTCSGSGVHITFIVRMLGENIVVGMNILIKPVFVNLRYECEPLKFITNIEDVKKELKAVIEQAIEKLKAHKTEQMAGRFYKKKESKKGA
jgi:hypothetical protein